MLATDRKFSVKLTKRTQSVCWQNKSFYCDPAPTKAKSPARQMLVRFRQNEVREFNMFDSERYKRDPEFLPAMWKRAVSTQCFLS